jgi:hypothetical protein
MSRTREENATDLALEHAQREHEKVRTPDFTATDHGSIVLLQPNTAAASTWADEHLPDDAPTFGKGFAVEKNYICDILQGIECDGLTWAQG